ncbi:MAG TPA: hypothetical protein VGM73_05210 [Candidatus Didemnitutus sp.]|jgi:hypothetical protein
MHLSKKARQKMKDLVLGKHRDWTGLHAALKAKGITIGQSSLDRFFSGKSNSIRTLRTLAASLGTMPESLVNQARILTRNARRSWRSNLFAPKPLDDPEAFRVAYQLWVEMVTRKVGLPIDPAEDVMTEIYDSWYSFFKSARELIKAIPLHANPRSVEMRGLVELSQAVLNDGLRPHLQRWQARFRHWDAAGNGESKAVLSPQEAQQSYPDWSDLRDDLLTTNQRLISYVCALEVMLGRRPAPARSDDRRKGKQNLSAPRRRTQMNRGTRRETSWS